jgi:hypothetical protein
VLAAVAFVPPLLMWARSQARESRTEVVTAAQLAAAADYLTAAALTSWGDQARMQGITTTAPVAVRWRAGPPDLAPEVLDLREARHQAPSMLECGRTGPGPCAGQQSVPSGTPVGQSSSTLSEGVVTAWYDDLYVRLGTDVLVVLGEPGSGKSGAMLLLLLEAVRRRSGEPDQRRASMPVPVWVTCGSWDPTSTRLPEHVAAVMARDYPGLTSPGHGGPAGPDALLRHGRIAVFLDGLDEMPPALRPAALDAVTQASRTPVVLTSRTNEYRAAAASGRFHPAAVIELCPVAPDTAAVFLLDRQTSARCAAWQPVLDHLRTEPGSPVAQVFATPLGLALARDTYTRDDPNGLLHTAPCTRQAVLAHLLGAFLEHTYPSTAGDRRDRESALYWLAWTARHMNGSRDLRWWDIPRWIPYWQLLLRYELTVTMTVGPGVGLGVGFGLGSGLGGGLIAGLVAGVGVTAADAVVGGLAGGFIRGLVTRLFGVTRIPHQVSIRRPTSSQLRTRFEVLGGLGLAFGLGAGLVVGLAVGLVAGIGFGLAVGAVGGLVYGSVVGLLNAWATPMDNSPAVTPAGSYRTDRTTALTYGLAGGLVASLVGALAGTLRSGLAPGLLGGLAVGVGVGLAAGLTSSFVTDVKVAQALLAVRTGRLVRFMPLFEDALHRQVLRQAGMVYQFRHAELQDYLAAQHRTGRRLG